MTCLPKDMMEPSGANSSASRRRRLASDSFRREMYVVPERMGPVPKERGYPRFPLKGSLKGIYIYIHIYMYIHKYRYK